MTLIDNLKAIVSGDTGSGSRVLPRDRFSNAEGTIIFRKIFIGT